MPPLHAVHAHGRQSRIHPRPDLSRRDASVLEREGDLALDGGGRDLALGILQHHADTDRELRGRARRRVRVRDLDQPREPTPVKLGNDPVQRQAEGGLARARGANEAHDFPPLDGKIDPVQRGSVRAGVVVAHRREARRDGASVPDQRLREGPVRAVHVSTQRPGPWAWRSAAMR